MSYRDRDRDKVPFISPEESLPAVGEPTGRWAEPYESVEDGMWRCYLRSILTAEQERAGLLYVVIGATREELAEAQAAEDAKFAKWQTEWEYWRHRP